MNKKKVFLYEKINQNQSGMKKHWILDFSEENDQYIEPIMGWTGSFDSDSQIRMEFNSKEDALNFAEKSGYEVQILDILKKNNLRKIKPKTYAENFS